MTEMSYLYIWHLIIIKRTTDLGRNGEVMKSDDISPFRILYYLIVVPPLIQFSKQVGLYTRSSGYELGVSTRPCLDIFF